MTALKVDTIRFDLSGEPRIEDNRQMEKLRKEDEIKFAMFAYLNQDPASCKEAMESKEKYDWMNAITEELKSMRENDVWILVDRPNKS